MAKRLSAEWTVTVERSPEEVFDYLIDLGKHHEWASGDFRIEDVSAVPLVQGATWTSFGFQPPNSKDHRNDVMVTELVRPSRFVFVATDEKKDEFINTYVLTPEGSGTKVERTMDLPKPGGAAGLAFPTILKTIVHPSVQKLMETFKANLEA